PDPTAPRRPAPSATRPAARPWSRARAAARTPRAARARPPSARGVGTTGSRGPLHDRDGIEVEAPRRPEAPGVGPVVFLGSILDPNVARLVHPHVCQIERIAARLLGKGGVVAGHRQHRLEP